MTLEEICKEGVDQPFAKLQKYNLIEEIIEKTKFLDECEEYISLFGKITYSQRIWHIRHNCFKIQYCPVCGKIARFNKHYGYVTCKMCKYKKIEETKIKNNSYEKGYEKQKQANLEKYGVEHRTQTDEFKEKARKTSLEKYGVKIPSQSEEIKEKISKTNLKRYGTKIPSQSKEIKKKIISSTISKYGIDNVMKLDFVKEKNFKQYETKEFNEEVERICIERLKNDGYLDKGYKYVRYIGQKTHIMYCPKCQKEFEINIDAIYRHRTKNNHELCTNCNPLQKGYSYAEKEVLDYVRSIYSGEIIENTKKVITPYELDIYLPELNLAIEYNGLFWHSSKIKDQKFHQMKSNLCKEKGVHLIHIFEDDWENKQEIWKSVLSNFINQSNQTVIYARKCAVQKVLLSDCNEFLTDNHLLGSVAAFSKCYGLYYNDELVSLMTFKLISKETNQYELSRYAIKRNYRIIGGAEKILSHFKKEMVGIASSIITYNDNSVFKGNIYPKLGFSYVRTNSPNYMFISKDTDYTFRFPKQSIRKLKVGYTKEVEQQLGYLRVYNAGNDVFTMELS